MPFSKVKWITFDAGWTLLFPNPSVGEIYAEILSRHGHEREPAVLEQWFVRVWNANAQKCLPVINAETEKERWREVIFQTFHELSDVVPLDTLFTDLWDAFCEAHRWRLPNHTERTLAELRARGYRLAVLSNWDERLRPLLTRIGLDTHFEEIFVSCEMGFEKPDPRLFESVETRLGASGVEILHIGDSHHHDVLGASARGWRAIQAFSNSTSAPDCTQIACFSELLELLPHRK